MLKVGITGGIGSGKSIITNVFRNLGVPVYNSDNVAKKIINTDLNLKKQLINNFGESIYLPNGKINRSLLSKIIFSDRKALEKVNSLVHPAVKQHFIKWMEMKHEYSYILKEAAILFESGTYKNLDAVVTVYSPVNLRISRVVKRNGISREQVISKINNQLSDEEKMKRSDYIIYNDDRLLVVPQVLKLHETLSNRSEVR